VVRLAQKARPAVDQAPQQVGPAVVGEAIPRPRGVRLPEPIRGASGLAGQASRRPAAYRAGRPASRTHRRTSHPGVRPAPTWLDMAGHWRAKYHQDTGRLREAAWFRVGHPREVGAQVAAWLPIEAPGVPPSGLHSRREPASPARQHRTRFSRRHRASTHGPPAVLPRVAALGGVAPRIAIPGRTRSADPRPRQSRPDRSRNVRLPATGSDRGAARPAGYPATCDTGRTLET
jgi:hypothetical protein